MKRFLLFLFFLCLDISSISATPAPILRLEMGMHTGNMGQMDRDRAEKLLVTGSNDKTARLWDLQSGALLRTLRLPIDSGDDGKVYAVAISPNGKTVAAAGWTEDDALYLFDSSNGSLKHRIPGLGSVTFHLAFSPDGNRLAASLGNGKGVRTYRRNGEQWQPAERDSGYGNDSCWHSFATDGRLVTTCYDGYLRLYDQKMKLLRKIKAPNGTRPYAAEFSPDGKRIAVSYDDNTTVSILDGTTLKRLFTADSSGMDNGNLLSLAWSQDGRFLYAAGMYDDGSGISPICRWSKGGRGHRQELPGTSDTISGLLSLADGRLVFMSHNPSWGILDAQGKRTFVKESKIADFRNMGGNFRLADNGWEFSFGYKQWGKKPATFSFKSLTFGPVTASLHSPKSSAGGLRLKNWDSDYHPTLNGKPLPLAQHEFSRSRAFAPDGRSFLLGAEWSLYSFNTDGSIRWQQEVPEIAWAVNISTDGRLAVAAFGDGTIRWYRYADGAPLLSFFPHKDQKRWIAWTPSGYYATSAGGDQLIGWHLNNGRDKAPDFFPATKFRSTYYRPDVVEKILVTHDEQKALHLAEKKSGRKIRQQKIQEILPPVVSLISPEDRSAFSSPQCTLDYQIHTPSEASITALKVLVDGRPLSGQSIFNSARIKKKGTLTITLPKRDCTVSLLAENRHAASEPATIRLQWQGEKREKQAAQTVPTQGPPPFVIKPKLYILAIGVSKYDMPELVLGYPAKDATDFVAAFRKQQNQVYREVKVRQLGDASKEDVLAGLEWLEKEATSNDVSALFIAGHGVNNNVGEFYFLPRNVNLERLRSTAISYATIKSVVANLPGKVLFFIDTCHSGNVMGSRRGAQVDLVAVANDLSAVENGVVVFASSTGRQYSMESAQWNNGAFTHAVVEGLNGKADYNNDRRISINEMNLYLSERVKELTSGKQTPTTSIPSTVPDFPIAVR